ncbi:MAG: heme exporter protein A [Oleiphilaceae bacterium]
MLFMLRVSELSCERDDRILFHDLNYDFPEGKIIQLEGQNGAGKTTLLRILAGLYGGFSGNVFWKGCSFNSVKIEFNQKLLFIGHKSAIKLTLSPIENLKFLIGLQQSFSEECLFEALDRVGLYGYENIPCRNLSAGQQRRVALARLYLSKASIWILDEIFTAIDKQGVAQLEQFLSDKAQEGITIILTTHHQLSLTDYHILNIGHFLKQEEAVE